RDVCKRNGLLILSVLSVTVGCLLGFFLRTQRLSPQEISYFQFPGELLMRMLKMLILPLVVSSLISGLASLDAKTSSRLGILTVAYYLWTTFVAVIVGIVMVSIIHPGGAAQKEETEQSGKPIMSSADALLDLIRNLLIIHWEKSCLELLRAQFLALPLLSLVMKLNSEGTATTILSVSASVSSETRMGLNFIRAVICLRESLNDPKGLPVPGIRRGLACVIRDLLVYPCPRRHHAGPHGESGAPLVSFCQCLNESVMKIVAVAVWYFPFGIVFLIAGKILEMDPTTVGKKLGFYAVTVVCGLVVHGLVILPLLYFFITRKNPIVFIRGVLQALLIALATSSSSATLPITFKCLLENNHIDRRIARFVRHRGAGILASPLKRGSQRGRLLLLLLSPPSLPTLCSITATAASIGAAGIPQAGLVTMVIVLTSVGLPTDDITLIIAVDWALDRFRTMINVLGDALAAGIMAHVCRKD
uniref:Amino acid transporter n=1 Tax=Myotis lucifugus TaxID=59463 RepID=G1NXU2_MYOLU